MEKDGSDPAPPSAGSRRRHKTCRRCCEPLPGESSQWAAGLTFPVAGLGTMHMHCAQAHCSERGLTLLQATPVCKHWSTRGHCIFQDSCFYLHPPEAQARLQAPQAPPTAAERAAKAAAWRAHNAAAHMRGSGAESTKAAPRGDPGRSASPDSVLARSLQPADGGETGGVPVCRGGASLPEDALFEAPDWGDVSGAAGMGDGAASFGALPRRKMGARQRNKIRNRFRAGVFRRFLLDTFGRERLASGSGVLDVAGGKGHIAFELVNLNGIPATVVEPRPISLAKCAVQLQAGFYHRNSVFRRHVDVPLAAFQQGQAITLPAQLRMVASERLSAALAAAACAAGEARAASNLLAADPAGTTLDGEAAPQMPLAAGCTSSVDAHVRTGSAAAAGAHAAAGQSTAAASPLHAERLLCDAAACREPSSLEPGGSALHKSVGGAAAGRQDGEQPPAAEALLPLVREAFEQACSIRWTRKGLEHEDESAPAWEENDSDEDGAEESSLPAQPITDEQLRAAVDTWQRCSVLLGMHPDQATGPIVDFAQRARKPFAVVPCCVYSGEFPRRRLPDGRPVKTYEDLIRYLVAKDPAAVQVRELPFEGRNKVVYCTRWTERDS